MKHILFFTLVLVLMTCSSCSTDGPIITETEHKGTAHFKIETKTATYYLEKMSGGLSSVIDNNGADWVRFSKSGEVRVPQSAASDFRGIPNLVYQGRQNGIGHPGFDMCTSELIAPNKIRTVSTDSTYIFSWTFDHYGATFAIEKADTSRNYWFLYEGPIAGRFSPPTHICYTNDGIKEETPSIFNNNPIKGNFSWVAFGDQNSDKVFYVSHLTPDDHVDIITYMGADENGNSASDGMVVLGFGRSPDTKPLMNDQNNKFRIGLLHTPDDDPENVLWGIKRKLN